MNGSEIIGLISAVKSLTDLAVTIENKSLQLQMQGAIGDIQGELNNALLEQMETIEELRITKEKLEEALNGLEEQKTFNRESVDYTLVSAFPGVYAYKLTSTSNNPNTPAYCQKCWVEKRMGLLLKEPLGHITRIKCNSCSFSHISL